MVDKKIFEGTGSSEPQGLKTASGVHSIASGGAFTDYTEIGAAWAAATGANHEATAWVVHPKNYKDLALLVLNSDGQYLQPPSLFSGMQALHTGNISQDSVYLGDFRQVLVGFRAGPGIEFSLDADEAFERHQLKIKVTVRWDSNIIMPAAMAVMSDITTTTSTTTTTT